MIRRLELAETGIRALYWYLLAISTVSVANNSIKTHVSVINVDQDYGTGWHWF